MQAPEKTIINISSNAGKRAVPSIAAYSAAKFAVVALNQAMAKENLDNGLKCVCVCPGGTNTPMREKIFQDAAKQQSADFVAETIEEIISGKIETETGCDVIIRHGEVTVNATPGK
jgi:NAD(P)-dependent dehydrogenase (short-subunit alcohol dehydrogenase family)